MKTSEEGLHRGLGERQIRLMALGAAIGVGLFLGSGNAIKWPVPASCCPTSSVARSSW
jgi:AAT family amino acid transporter